MNSLLQALNSSSKITKSLVLNPTIEVTFAPFSCKALATGKAIAQPTPPPTTQTFLKPSTSLGFPKGPTKLYKLSPSFKVLSL